MQPGTNKLFFGKGQAVPSGVRLNFTGNVNLQASAKSLPLFRAFSKCFFLEPGPQSSPTGEQACPAWSIESAFGASSMVMDHCGVVIPFEVSGRVRMQDGKLRKGSGALDIAINIPFMIVDDEFMAEIAGAKPEQEGGKIVFDKRCLPEHVFLTRQLTETKSALKMKINETKKTTRKAKAKAGSGSNAWSKHCKHLLT